jgi:hypothetical protein
VRHGGFIIAAIAALCCLFPRTGGGEQNAPDPHWVGVGGLVMPTGETTPVRINQLKLTFTAIPPVKRTLEDPRIAEQWEVSTGMILENTSAEPCTLSLALPQVPAAAGAGAPAIDHVIISLDQLRMKTERVDVPGPQIEGLPELVFRHRVAIDFEPGQKHRVDTLFRMPGRTVGNETRMRFIMAGVARFAGDSVGETRFEWEFGDRVRLVPIDGKKLGWIADPPDGTGYWFYDNGRRTKLRIEIENYRPAALVELPVVPAGLGPQGGPKLIGEIRPIEQLSALELKLARWTLLALHGRMFRDPEAREVFEDLPWEDCNPAYRVAHGTAVTARSIDEFTRAHPCSLSCRERRAESVDPYGSAWDKPLCWYSPVHTLAQTQVHDVALREQIRAIEQRLRRVDPQSMTPPKKKRPADPAPAGSGCGCSFAIGSRR